MRSSPVGVRHKCILFRLVAFITAAEKYGLVIYLILKFPVSQPSRPHSAILLNRRTVVLCSHYSGFTLYFTKWKDKHSQRVFAVTNFVLFCKFLEATLLCSVPVQHGPHMATKILDFRTHMKEVTSEQSRILDHLQWIWCRENALLICVFPYSSTKLLHDIYQFNPRSFTYRAWGDRWKMIWY